LNVATIPLEYGAVNGTNDGRSNLYDGGYDRLFRNAQI
jgi:hypothetical protein